MENKKQGIVQRHSKFLHPCFALFSIFAFFPLCQSFDYGEALFKSLLYFESQRSGRLPHNQRVTWRHHSGLTDGLEQGVDLVGGYYDAGDNVKFGLPMAFTITMLSWGVIEYGEQIATAGEYGHALEAIKWGTDYFIKAPYSPKCIMGRGNTKKLVANLHVIPRASVERGIIPPGSPEIELNVREVGDGVTDHYCWQRPEDMTTSRHAYKVDANNPGSDVVGETAAAMAAASIVFRETNPYYTHLLLHHAEQLFEFGDKYRGKYDESIGVVKGYYASYSGYMDELLWAALWLYKATNKEVYLKYVLENAHSFGGITWTMTEFSWDVKYVGVQIIASMARTPGGLIYIRQWNNMQYVSTAAFLLTLYSDYLEVTNQKLNCDKEEVSPQEMLSFAKSQVDYILGSNPMAISYLVGYGPKYPQRVHHRGASIKSYKGYKGFIGCTEGYDNWYGRRDPNPNVVIGALVGGPDIKDQFRDERSNFVQTEACTYNTATLVGVLAKLHRLNQGDISASPALIASS
uniref:Endoglucanase n=1 Tax=Fagus sylvatica TaxID=28930 RepID=A0A2N9HQH5_FAGSY